jgi:hypothetical protein
MLHCWNVWQLTSQNRNAVVDSCEDAHQRLIEREEFFLIKDMFLR